MEVLIDTHALIWFIKGDNSLSDKAKTIIESEDNLIYVSIVSIWEIVIKTNIGKPELNKSVDDIFNFLNDNQFHIINILQNHLSTQLLLPPHHRDPLTGY
jgi:PIN domain nuclease of toxin-antitoxin system